MNTNDKIKIDGYFQGLDVDYSKIEGSLEMAEFMASFISKYVKKGVPLKLVAYGITSVYHDLFIVGKEYKVVTFRPSVGQYDLKNIYDGDEVIVNVPHQDKYFYYINELIKNITFCNYLISDDGSYVNSRQLKNTDLCKRLNVFATDDYDFKYGVSSIEDTGMVYRFPKYSIFISIKINQFGTTFCFSGRYDVPSSVPVVGQYFKTFHELVCHMNKYVYDNVVEKEINIPAHEFLIEHREVMKMIAI